MRQRQQLANSWKTLILLSVLLLNACASPPQIRVNIDKYADFSAYRSYGFIDPLGTDKAGYTTLVTKYLRDAVSEELEQRGYVFSTDPDLLVNFFARLENRIHITSAPTPLYYGGYYDYRYGVYDAYPRYTYRSYSYSYKEGTVNVDLIDAQKKQMVWEGVAVNEVDKKDLHNPELALRKVIADIFKSYPFRADSARNMTNSK
jgi:hypothetical protein